MQKQLLTNGNAFKRTDGRWGGVVWYKDEKGERKRKSFSGTTKAEVNKKMTDYITKFEEEIIDAIEGNKTVKDSLLNYLQVFKYPNVERVTYDRNEQIYKNQIVPYMGKLIVSNITGADIKRLISTLTDKGYSFSTVKQTYNLLNEYFDYLMREEFIKKNPMNAVPTIKKSNYLAKQNKEVLPVCETITVFTDDEIEKFKAEAYKKYPSGKPKHNQASVYKGYKRDKIEMRGDRAEISDFPLYLNTVAGGLDRRDQTIGGFSFVVKIYALPVVEIIG